MRAMVPLLAVAFAVAARCADLPGVVLGDYDAEPRGADGRVDIPLLVSRLRELHANTYMWLIWHAPTDWDDLHRFLPEAAREGVQVWAYLCPHSEQGPEGRYPFCEPYRTDFVRWAREIAQLSLQHPNLVGWVIDDFMANFHEGAIPQALVSEMQKTAKGINPGLRFYPLLYFPEIGLRFALELAPLVDGVVAAYHRGREDIEAALPYLADDYVEQPSLVVQFPPGTPSAPGDCGMASQTARVQPGQRPFARFRYRDSYDGPTSGYHLMQLRIDDQVAWSEDCAGTDTGEAEVDLAPLTAGKDQVAFALGVLDAKGVSEYGLTAQFSGLEVKGLTLDADLGREAAWQPRVAGRFAIRLVPSKAGGNRYRLPLIVMPAASRGEYRHRYHEDPTPDRIAARTRQALELTGDGRVLGTVLYCLDKSPASADLEALADLFGRFSRK